MPLCEASIRRSPMASGSKALTSFAAFAMSEKAGIDIVNMNFGCKREEGMGM